MHILLYAVASWIAVDVVLVLAWQRAHVVSRRGAALAIAAVAVDRPAQPVPAHHPSRAKDLAGVDVHLAPHLGRQHARAVEPLAARTAEPLLARTAEPLRLVEV